MKVDPRSITDGWRYAHGYYSKHSSGAMCKEGKLCQDGNATIVSCRIKGLYADCEYCEHNDDYAMFVDKDEYLHKK